MRFFFIWYFIYYEFLWIYVRVILSNISDREWKRNKIVIKLFMVKCMFSKENRCILVKNVLIDLIKKSLKCF